MRAPMSWLGELVALPPGETGRSVAERLTEAGLKVEAVLDAGAGLRGPVVVAEVLAYEEEQHSNGKTIRWCTVVDGTGERGVVCGARNFEVGDRVVLAVPGAELPGGFPITARKTYGHVSDGMICSTRELGVGDDHTGILVLAGDPPVGSDAIALLGLRDEVLDIAVTPDRGYALSMRGVAREVATAYDNAFDDPAAVQVPRPAADGWPVRIDAPARCDRFVARTVTGINPAAATPDWMAGRLRKGGMRPVFLAVDVTNYVMLELGQPLHAYDRSRLTGPIVVRQASSAGERIRTLDGTDRVLDVDDLVIADDSGAIGIAGVMGGARTEVSAATTDVVIEAAHFEPTTVARSARRHRLPSEASRRFERGVDPELAGAAAARVAQLLVDLAGAQLDAGGTDAGVARVPVQVRLPIDLCTRLGGRAYDVATVVRRLTDVGCVVGDAGADPLDVVVPSWRPDLRQPVDLVEEVLRLEGYDTIPSLLPRAPAGRGLTPRQRLIRRIGRALAAAGYIETPTFPFLSPATFDALGLPPDDARRHANRLANPLSEEEPLLRTTLLPGLLATLVRNAGRGAHDVGLFEHGLVFRPGPGTAPAAPQLGVDRRPTDAELAALEAALPEQPTRVAVVVAGERERTGWWGAGRPAEWPDAVEAARVVAREAGVELEIASDVHPPWHPGRCAVLRVRGEVVGHAGELHPRVVGALGLPPRTSAMELDLELLGANDDPVHPPPISPYPVATVDVALVVDASVPAAAVESALRSGTGDLLESLRLFDVYTGAQVGEGRRSLAFTLRLRAPDRTLTAEEVAAVRDAAVAEAAARTGAVLRS